MTLEEWLSMVREPWMRDALCNEYPKRLFFPERGEPTLQAKAVCHACLVRTECLDFALVSSIKFGIWGGTSERQRRQLRRSSAA